MESLRPSLILVPTDFSGPAAHAVRYASALGERFGAHLLVIYADAFIPPVDFTASGAGSFSVARDVMVDEAREQLVAHAENNIGRNVPYDTRVVVGDAVDAITRELQESGANLVVMGTHGRSGVPRLVFGSVTEAVMRVATAPVIAVNAGTTESGSVSRILCPVNFTDACRAALRQAVALLDGPDAPILLFHALEGKELQPSINELIRLHEWAPPEIAGRCELKTMPSRAPVEAILDLALATAADLIVLDVAPGRSLYESLRGTVAERIVQASHCPVLTMNAFAARALQSAGSVRELALA